MSRVRARTRAWARARARAKTRAKQGHGEEQGRGQGPRQVYSVLRLSSEGQQNRSPNKAKRSRVRSPLYEDFPEHTCKIKGENVLRVGVILQAKGNHLTFFNINTQMLLLNFHLFLLSLYMSTFNYFSFFIFRSLEFGPGNGTIWNNFDCEGYESNLIDCDVEWDDVPNQCISHQGDAGVICSPILGECGIGYYFNGRQV